MCPTPDVQRSVDIREKALGPESLQVAIDLLGSGPRAQNPWR
jgi:hypothetical protein